MTSQEIMSTLQREVGEWSQVNFGDQASKTHIPLVLGSVAPILGIIEEFGEMDEALVNRDITLAKDSVADILIYLADYFCRIAIKDNLYSWRLLDWHRIDKLLIIETPSSSPEKTASFLLRKLGRFAHINLKRHQGIRGYADDNQFHSELGIVLNDIFIGLGRFYACAKRDYFAHITTNAAPEDIKAYAAVDSAELLNIAWLEWQNVKQRNWKTNSISG